MKLLLCPDTHLRETNPENRIDDYFTTQSKKEDFIIETAKKNECQAILKPGDIFDSFKASDFLLAHYIEKYRYAIQQPGHGLEGLHMIVIHGQHDLKFHSKDYTNIPLAVLDAARVIEIAGNEKIIVGDGHDFCCIYGASWGEEIPIPEPLSRGEKGINILMVHAMIGNEKIWEGQKDFIYASDFLRKHKEYDLIVSGDNHKTFYCKEGNRFLFNMGSLMRSTIDQTNHKPMVALFDTQSLTYELIQIPIEPAETVFNLEKVEQQKEKSKEIEAFVEGLKSTEIVGLDFLSNLQTYLDDNKIEDKLQIRPIISEVLNEGGQV